MKSDAVKSILYSLYNKYGDKLQPTTSYDYPYLLFDTNNDMTNIYYIGGSSVVKDGSESVLIPN